MKKCTACKKEKELNQFVKSKLNKDGLSYTCKECKKEYAAEYYKKNNEKFRVYREQYRVENYEKLKDFDRARNKKRQDARQNIVLSECAKDVRFFVKTNNIKITKVLELLKISRGTYYYHSAKLNEIHLQILKDYIDGLN